MSTEAPLASPRTASQFIGEVFYDPKTNRFVQIRGIKDDYLNCGGFREFFEDAKSTVGEQRLSYAYAANLQHVLCPDQCEAAHYNGIGWAVKNRPSKSSSPE